MTDLLAHFHNLILDQDYYVPRKYQIPALPRVHLFGVRGSGKSSLAVEYAQDFDKNSVLYIDFEDPALTFNRLSTPDMQQFIDHNAVTLLILDHYDRSKLEILPKADKIITLSRVPMHLEGFDETELFPLDYEEFLAFEKGAPQTAGFNHFLKAGTLPQMARSGKTATALLKNFFQSKFDMPEQYLLIILAIYQTKHLTIHQIYTYAKEHFKISKDWLYQKIKLFIEEGIVFFIEDIYQTGGRKMILFDFAFAKYLAAGQPFIVQFDAMVALSLLKHQAAFKSLGIHGYLTEYQELIIPAPFESEESIWKKSSGKYSLYRKYGVQKVTIVTVANSYEFTIDRIVFEALPFYEWSILDENTDDMDDEDETSLQIPAAHSE